MSATGATLREGRSEDLDRVAEIYTEQVRGGVATFDTEPKAAEDFAGRLGGDPTCPFLVATVDGVVAGFAWAGWFRPRPAYAGTRETSIYLASSARGRGLGRALYGRLLTDLDVVGVHTEVAVIARPNVASEALHTSLGFTLVGTLREVGHKFGAFVDTAWYQRMHPSA